MVEHSDWRKDALKSPRLVVCGVDREEDYWGPRTRGASRQVHAYWEGWMQDSLKNYLAWISLATR